MFRRLSAFIIALMICALPVITWAADETDNPIQLPQSSSDDQMQAVNQQMDQVEAGKAPLDTAKHSETLTGWDLEITPESSYIRYHEPTLMKETGNMYGINADFIYHPPKGNMLNTEITDMYRLDTMFSYGKVDYRGGYVSNGVTVPAGFNGIDDYMVEIRGISGKDFFFNNGNTRLTPYIGGGYRSLYDSLYEFKPGGYDRRIQYLYFPTGGEIMTKLGNGWSIGADAEYDIFLRGFVTSYLETIGLGKLTNTQKNGYGVRGSIKILKNYGNFNFIFEPYVRFWHIQTSRLDTSTPFIYQGRWYIVNGWEPNNNSLELGGKLGIEF
jgi:hypothetical protein